MHVNNLAVVRDPVSDGNPVTAARSRITELFERVIKSAQSVRGVADELYGPVGTGAGASPSSPTRCGEFGMLHDGIDALSAAIFSLEQEVGRLAPLGPEEKRVNFTNRLPDSGGSAPAPEGWVNRPNRPY